MLAFHPPEFSQPLSECVEEGGAVGTGPRVGRGTSSEPWELARGARPPWTEPPTSRSSRRDAAADGHDVL